MTWISLICLLALSGAAFGRSSYGSFSGSSLFKTKPVVPLTAPVSDLSFVQAPISSGYGSSYGSGIQRSLIFDQPKPETLPLSEADILCKGKFEGSVIVLLGGEKFVICTADSKGDEIFCPKGLLYNEETRRCERKYNPSQNPCASQPCLNNGRCIPTQYSYQCECGQGFSGRTCELDASVCQQQQPCGASFDSVCQSFHVGSALKHVCLLQEGRSYGLTASQAFANPCLSGEGLHPLAFGNKGFVMCDGDQMFIQSCPGGTIWDSLSKVCVWPEMEGTISIKSISLDSSNYGSSYGSSYSESVPAPVPRPVEQVSIQRKFDLPVQSSSYGSQIGLTRDLPVQSSSYGSQIGLARDLPVQSSSYGSQIGLTRDLPVQSSSYGSQIGLARDLPVHASSVSYGAQVPLTRDLPFQVPSVSYGSQIPMSRDLPIKVPSVSYGGQGSISRDLPVRSGY